MSKCYIPDGGAAMCKIESIPADTSTHNDGSKGDTAIVFDWEDTLMCSSAFTTGKIGSQTELLQLERAIESILNTARQLGEVVIVTNSKASTVFDNARIKLPGLLSILQVVKVISARDLYEQSYPGDPVRWKQFAFADFIAGISGTNLVVLGDSMTDIIAAKNLRGNLSVKTVKFKEAPSVTDLIKQLCRVARDLGAIVHKESDAEITLVHSRKRSRSPHT